MYIKRNCWFSDVGRLFVDASTSLKIVKLLSFKRNNTKSVIIARHSHRSYIILIKLILVLYLNAVTAASINSRIKIQLNTRAVLLREYYLAPACVCILGGCLLTQANNRKSSAQHRWTGFVLSVLCACAKLRVSRNQ